MDLGLEMASEVILVIEELNGAASTRLGEALHIAANSFISLSEREKKEAVNRSWGSANKLVVMLNKDYPPCL